jgi:hypothetical protein
MKNVYAKFTLRHNLMVKIELFANKIYAKDKKNKNTGDFKGFFIEKTSSNG